ncbi:MAG TPA: nuclear transport factor 2 family protein [Terriglobales bacterium]|nr:nuclear transport factor 2 family protein [Terriglobales bacterium]
MKRILAVTIVLVMSMVSAVQFNPVANAQGKGGAIAEEAILKLEQAWLAAVKNNTPEEANRLFAENAVFTDADGTTHGKADELNSMNKVKWETAEDSDIKMIQHGNTVIVTGKFEGKGKDDLGKKVDVSERWTDVWMETEHMGWQVVASHSSPVKK